MRSSDTGRLWRMEGVRGGRVCFDRTGIPVESVAERFAAGESIESLMRDYPLNAQDIEAGLRLVISGACGRRGGLLAAVERRMLEQIPLLRTRSQRTVEPARTTDASDPHVTSTGKPSTRAKRTVK